MKKTSKQVSDSLTTMSEIVMPNDTNPLNNLMGGNLMRWMDICGSICAAKHAASHVVTASVDNVSFQDGIRLGEVVTLKACVTRAWNTSLEIFVEVTANDMSGSGVRKSNQAYLTFVAIDKDSMKPRQVPEVLPISNEEVARFEGANRRREIRLIQSGRLKPSDAKETRAYLSEG